VVLTINSNHWSIPQNWWLRCGGQFPELVNKSSQLNYARNEDLFFYACSVLSFHVLNAHIQASVYTHQFYLSYSTIKVVVGVVGQCAIAVDAAVWQCGRRRQDLRHVIGRVGPRGAAHCVFRAVKTPLRASF
jgi:hypothetical protein